MIKVEAMVDVLAHGEYLVVAQDQNGRTVRREVVDVQAPALRGPWAVRFSRGPELTVPTGTEFHRVAA